MNDKQKKIIQKCWEVLLFIFSLVMVIIGIIKIAKPDLLNLSTEGGIVFTILGMVTLQPNTIISMWIRQIMNRKHILKIKGVLEDSGVKVPKNEKQSKKPTKNELKQQKQNNKEPTITGYGI